MADAKIADEKTLDILLREARTHGDFLDKPVDEALLRAAHELMKWGPTTANSQPARVLFLVSRESKERLKPALSAVTVEKTMKAPAVALVAYDTRFFELLPRLYHNPDAINWYSPPDKAEINGFRNGSLQGAYLILALRAVGLDCGAMSGFDIVFPSTRIGPSSVMAISQPIDGRPWPAFRARVASASVSGQYGN